MDRRRFERSRKQGSGSLYPLSRLDKASNQCRAIDFIKRDRQAGRAAITRSMFTN